MNALARRAPIWSPAMTTYLKSKHVFPADPSDAPDTSSSPPPAELPAPRLTAELLRQIGLPNLASAPTDPRLLAQHLKADDDADARVDSDEFARGIRRAVRFQLAFQHGLHKRAGKPWKAWISEHFKAGYECFNRYHVAAELQIGLLSRGLPPLTSTYQSRALAPYRKAGKFWDVLAALLKDGFPPKEQLISNLRQELGLNNAPSTPRIGLHRVLDRLIRSVSGADQDPLVAQALAKLTQAKAILEHGKL